MALEYSCWVSDARFWWSTAMPSSGWYFAYAPNGQWIWRRWITMKFLSLNSSAAIASSRASSPLCVRALCISFSDANTSTNSVPVSWKSFSFWADNTKVLYPWWRAKRNRLASFFRMHSTKPGLWKVLKNNCKQVRVETLLETPLA